MFLAGSDEAQGGTALVAVAKLDEGTRTASRFGKAFGGKEGWYLAVRYRA